MKDVALAFIGLLNTNASGIGLIIVFSIYMWLINRR